MQRNPRHHQTQYEAQLLNEINQLKAEREFLLKQHKAELDSATKRLQQIDKAMLDKMRNIRALSDQARITGKVLNALLVSNILAYVIILILLSAKGVLPV